MDKFFPHKELSYRVVGLLYKIRKDYGSAQKEIIYQNALVEELEEAKIPYKREVDIPIISSKTKKRLGNYRADFLIDNKIILEIKAIKFTFDKLEQQVFSYLKSTPYEIAYLVNFGSPKLYLKRYILTNDRKPSVISVSRSVNSVSLGFTLMELLIIIAIIAILAAVAIVLLNPWQQIAKAQDSRRKNDLAALQKVFEDYYNDKSCYPKPNEVCYPSSQLGYNPQLDTKCYICGNEPSPANFANFSPYMARLPCDPQHPTYKYLYQVENLTCPSWYRIYSELSATWSRESDSAGCGEDGCGLSPNYGYDYGISSPNIALETTPWFFCSTKGSPVLCNVCETYPNCISSPGCNKIYPSIESCWAENPPP